MQGLLKHVLDHNKHVQEAACSALATLIEQSTPEQLIPKLKVTLLLGCTAFSWGQLSCVSQEQQGHQALT